MARAGRKRKQGKREPNGRIVRIQFDHGTARAQMKFSQYGTDGADAIGRAYQAGLLGEQGDALRDTARKIARAYWPMLEIGAYRCTLNDARGGAAANDEDTSGFQKSREIWLTDMLRKVDAMSRAHRRAFDELVIDIHPDTGPVWLERMIYCHKHEQSGSTMDAATMRLALDAITQIMA